MADGKDNSQNVTDTEDAENIESTVTTPRSARRANVIKTIINQLPLNVNQLDSIKHEITPRAQLQSNIDFIKEQLNTRGIYDVQPKVSYIDDFTKKDSSTSYDNLEPGYYMSRMDKGINVGNEEIFKIIRYETSDYSQYVDMNKIEKDSLDYDSLGPKINIDSDKESNYFHLSSIPRDIEMSNYYGHESNRSDTIHMKQKHRSSASLSCQCSHCRLFRDKINQTNFHCKDESHYQQCHNHQKIGQKLPTPHRHLNHQCNVSHSQIPGNAQFQPIAKCQQNTNRIYKQSENYQQSANHQRSQQFANFPKFDENKTGSYQRIKQIERESTSQVKTNNSFDPLEFYERALEQRHKRCKYFHQNRANPHGIYREYIPTGLNPFDIDNTIGDVDKKTSEQLDNITVDNNMDLMTGPRNWFVKKLRSMKRHKNTDSFESQSWRGKFVGFFRSVFSCASVVST